MTSIIVNTAPIGPLMVGTSQCFVRLTGEDTGGQLSIVEFTMPPGAMGAAPHIHHGHTEEFVITEGEITFDLAPGTEVVGAGGTVSVPPGAAHGFRNASGQPARLIGLFRPAGYEQYFREVHEMVVSGHMPTPEDLAKLRARFNTTSL
ncbi:cupin domain-containing protein [Allorhizocola rhizosphaerae]|uniref:cupin domain-containing protein n=1 Tax=Allorhizocola rhizosphaerae TaxID=1872709 RepID=UPI000E3D609B|nr:cupin domain-containing protein [Allorhizocola rhizosphaerae]